jgi:uncharacterized protein YbjT (DUF2867 family)
MTRVLITGGTGRAGRPVVPRLRDAGCEVRVLSHTREGTIDGVDYLRADLLSGAGVPAALRGARIIVHCAGAASWRKDQAITANLIRAARELDREPHLVKISVVGADRIPVASRLDKAMFGYFDSMLTTERAVQACGLPWTILRATQFCDAFVTVARAMTKLPVVPVASGARFQPVDTRDVADRLAELALGEPAGLVPDIAGPKAYPMADLIRGYLRATGKHRLLMPMRLAGKAARAVRDGANLPAGNATIGSRSWEDFLTEQKF